MGSDLQTGRARWRAWWARRSRVGRVSLWLLAAFSVAVVAEGLDIASDLDTVVITLASVALFPLLLVLLYRWFVYRVLWKVRNRLILTYLLMGLAPVVMFATLVGIAAYLLAGQYATDMGTLQVNQGLARLHEQAAIAAVFGSPARTAGVGLGAGPAGAEGAGIGRGAAVSGGVDGDADGDADGGMDGGMDGGTDPAGRAGGEDGTPLSLMELRGNAWAPLEDSGEKARTGPLTSGPPPGWLHPGFQGVVELRRKLYLCAEVSAPRNGRTVVVLASRPLTRDELNGMAKGLGRIILSQGFSRLASHAEKDDADTGVVGTGVVNTGVVDTGVADTRVVDTGVVDTGVAEEDKGGHMHVHVAYPKELRQGEEFDAVSSEPMKRPRHAYVDPPVVFTAMLPVTGWSTGKEVTAMIAVISRPTLLYAELYASSVKIGRAVWTALIGIAIFFALLEMVALLMATSLSLTITRSVAELYRGTREIDKGNLEHRIPVRRRDQLAALAGSFNGMAASVSELLVQQREKERLLNELAIAKEVQATLFPPSPAALPGFEMHGVCVPARTVGGDYFDFMMKTGVGGGATLALGDISGKGIAAALLMSSLHSADRAFSLGWGAEEGLPPSPALLLKLLNEHLFRSTQSARYATLFLAFYDAGTRRLTYANGGHLPPLVISKEGTVRRLDRGGSVVGLLDGLEYEEATVALEPGDLLVAFTDGLTEPENGTEEFGEERLLEFVRRHRELPLTVLATMTLKTVQAWFGEREQPDDMTILLARSCADGGRSYADGEGSCADGGRSYADGEGSCADGGRSCADGEGSCADGEGRSKG